MTKLIIAFIISFIFSALAMPCIIKFFKTKHASQTILGYVEEHKQKNGTITMGGVVFMLVTSVLSFVFLKFDISWFITLLVSICFGVLGLMDDYLKIKYKQNLGLRPYQKIIGQLGISIIFALFIFFNIKTNNLFFPFTTKSLNVGVFIVPLIIIVLLSTTNSVNLTDGLDGLAGSVTVVYLVMFTIITSILSAGLYNNGETDNILTNITNINILSMLFAGSIMGFLIFNTSKASIFMGDAGSLCLGGYIGASACILGQEFLLPILGFCFVFSALSVIMQVIYFKLTKKRIFKMAPFHHHLQMSGLSEPKIVFIYSALTLCLGLVCIVLYIM